MVMSESGPMVDAWIVDKCRLTRNVEEETVIVEEKKSRWWIRMWRRLASVALSCSKLWLGEEGRFEHLGRFHLQRREKKVGTLLFHSPGKMEQAHHYTKRGWLYCLMDARRQSH